MPLNKRGPLFCSSGWGRNHRSYLLLTGQLFEGGRGCVCVCVFFERAHLISHVLSTMTRCSHQSSINSTAGRSLSISSHISGNVTCTYMDECWRVTRWLKKTPFKRGPVYISQLLSCVLRRYLNSLACDEILKKVVEQFSSRLLEHVLDLLGARASSKESP